MRCVIFITLYATSLCTFCIALPSLLLALLKEIHFSLIDYVINIVDAFWAPTLE